MKISYVAAILCFACANFAIFPVAYAQTFQTAVNNPGNGAFYPPSYPILFVSAKIKLQTTSTGVEGDYHLGTDVLSASNPDGGNKLWILLPDGQVKLLFPLPAHQGVPGLIDTPTGSLDVGSVVEPNLSENGKIVYFSYFHNADDKASQSYLPKKGADLYRLDLTPLLANWNTDPSTLPVMRLTTRTYNSQGNLPQSELFKDALNPTLAGSYVNNWGTVYMHAEEMRTAHGLKLVYVSDELRVQNSNSAMGSYNNHTFNLYIADIESDGTLTSRKQFQYYTTTSALSPNRLKNGIAFSYQANTEDGRNWQMQGISSAGAWYPINGYGINPGLFHLGTFCTKTTGSNPGNYLVATRYYNQNNEGFGSLWTQDLSLVGQNAYDVSVSSVIVPRQIGSNQITLGVKNGDDPSGKKNGVYIGKFTSPRCGRANEVYFAYTPTSANGRLNDPEGNKNIYEAYIGFRPNLENFDPVDPPSLGNQTGVLKVIEDNSKQYNLIWPLPVLSWLERSGDATQRFSDPPVTTGSSVQPGMPYGEVGTSAIWNTDRRPFDCWLGSNGQTPWSPNKAHSNINQENDLLHKNTDALTIVKNQSNLCAPLAPADVLGIAVRMTSNKIKTGAHDYETSGGGPQETSRLLGVYSVVGQADQSFKAMVPANVPFDLHLLDGIYGLKLVDVRSWHSLKEEEVRTNCGGCHQHEVGMGIPFAGTVADQNLPLDMVTQTTYVEYDPLCAPKVKTSTSPALPQPEWIADIWPKFDQHCGSCHNSAISSNTQALAALGYTGEGDAYNKLRARNYANHRSGALGSAAFWAARGRRTDGRNNTLAKYAPDYPNQVWGFFYSSVHDTNPGLCNGTNPDGAKWVYAFGSWIDNHMPRTSSGGIFNATLDRYHPTISSAISDTDCSPGSLRVGFWDDAGTLSAVTISVNGQVRALHNTVPNGSVSFSLSGLSSADKIGVLAEDPTGNRQKNEKSLDELLLECNMRLTGGTQGGGGNNGGGNGSSFSALFSIVPPSAAPGKRVTISVDAQNEAASAFKLYCTNSGTDIGVTIDGTPLNLNSSDLLDRTAALPMMTLADGKAAVRLPIPLSKKIIGTIDCQAVILTPPGLSNVASFTVAAPKSKKAAKRKLRQIAKKRSKRMDACHKAQAKKGAKFTARAEEICAGAQQLKLEWKLRGAFAMK